MIKSLSLINEVQFLLRKFYITILAPRYKAGFNLSSIRLPWNSIGLYGSSYRLLSGNCQHFVEFVLGNIASNMYKPEAQGTILFDDLTHHFWEKLLTISVTHVDQQFEAQRSTVPILQVMFDGK